MISAQYTLPYYYYYYYRYTDDDGNDDVDVIVSVCVISYIGKDYYASVFYVKLIRSSIVADICEQFSA